MLDVFLMIRLGTWILGGKDYRDKMPFSSITSRDPASQDFDLGCQLCCGVGVPPPASLPSAALGGSHCVAPTAAWGFSFTPPLLWRGIYMNYSEFFCTDFSLLSHLLIYSIIYLSVCTHGYLFNTLGCNPILSSFIVQIAAALALGSFDFLLSV